MNASSASEAGEISKQRTRAVARVVEYNMHTAFTLDVASFCGNNMAMNENFLVTFVVLEFINIITAIVVVLRVNLIVIRPFLLLLLFFLYTENPFSVPREARKGREYFKDLVEKGNKKQQQKQQKRDKSNC
ncbi:hypothetical protein, unlikely [Trypanosoma brucei gambiense DAL972]|uniref:Uncharacterized protein n=1 Tax=Trypanosoma brucei gambiense (strain MHOM/CI/86/DAL972) TaxID=679716 RepID=C9ZWS6_TRYB9|nr:hypothetical protein, unlikely [Trypanosoma brucei gambiense DAL972]CBH13865.1 hypothetical protein, unlikely [Trypanosoma brucei gambiense DAL972]|eukprot:XP_011776141.1 hypothetical protein, unlikely [Trypanosoma brucei gambiense DAL972]